MPHYEYHCPDCDHYFSVFMTLEEHEESNPPLCPACGGKNARQTFTSFSVQTSKKS